MISHYLEAVYPTMLCEKNIIMNMAAEYITSVTTCINVTKLSLIVMSKYWLNCVHCVLNNVTLNILNEALAS